MNDEKHPIDTSGKPTPMEQSARSIRGDLKDIAHDLGHGKGSEVLGDVKSLAKDMRHDVRNSLNSFIEFVREQGVVGLAIGFLLSGAVSGTVTSLVNNVINPIIGLALGKVNLSDKMIVIGEATIKYGAFISSVIDFIIVAAVIYFIFRGLRLDRLDKKKAE